MYEPRIYRDRVNRKRFRGTKLQIEESDLWIGVDSLSYERIDFKLLETHLYTIRRDLQLYIVEHNEFLNSLEPLAVLENDPEFVVEMKNSGHSSSTGPMSAVAGYVAREMAVFIEENFQVSEIFVENGGDICLKINSPLHLALDMGENQNFTNLGLEILPHKSFIGICSSSGMFGHSLSLGKADLVMTISENPLLADSWATSLANRVKDEKDVELLPDSMTNDLIAMLAVKDKKIAYKGPYRFIRLD